MLKYRSSKNVPCTSCIICELHPENLPTPPHWCCSPRHHVHEVHRYGQCQLKCWEVVPYKNVGVDFWGGWGSWADLSHAMNCTSLGWSFALCCTVGQVLFAVYIQDGFSLILDGVVIHVCFLDHPKNPSKVTWHKIPTFTAKR